MKSEFWHIKMKTYFRCLDLDGDGTVNENDFVELGNRFIESSGFSDGDARVLREDLSAFWENNWKQADANEDGQVTEEEFIGAMTIAVNDPSRRDGITDPLYILFKAIDADNEGDISLLEFETFYQCLGINTEFIEEIFAGIDTDGDEIISKQEFISSGREFFLGEDESHPSQFFWGPLVAH